MLRDWVFRILGVVVTHKEGPEIKGFDNGGDIDCLYDNKCNGLWLEARNKAENIFTRFYDLSQQYALPIFVVIIPQRRPAKRCLSKSNDFP